MGRVTCLVRGCFSKAGEGIGMFKLPLDDKERVKAWLLACNREDLMQKPFEDLNYYKICEQHFEKKFVIKGARHHLHEEAIPTIFHGLKRKIGTVIPDQNMENKNTMHEFIIPESSSVTLAKKRHRCCVNGCDDLLSIRHRFPKREPEIFEAWIKILKPPHYQSLSVNDIYNKYVVCDVHFRECDKIPKMSRKRGLSAIAIPTLKIPELDSEFIEAVIKDAIEKREKRYMPNSFQSNDFCENIAIEFPDNYTSTYQIIDSVTNEEYVLDDTMVSGLSNVNLRTGKMVLYLQMTEGQLRNNMKIEEIPKCEECKQDAVGKSVINCDKGCGKLFHISCVQISRQNLDLLKMIEGVTWLCKNCRNK
ncbi:uncharacterized protein LOC130442182 isoform X1 [Diorhabda sublineata]|uniref:uncharacterized protein LOC130442182 isoform X1 n=1 Tax=Diorhabda sublineata TaxID=1163346 RepID=UPI0024E0E9A2|nr:uncharacterized protein LOC130442182 isoform X1 [Diorhabda sublineata]